MRVSRPLEAQLPVWGVSVLESHHARNFQTVFAAHPFFQLLFVLRGQGTLHLHAPNSSFSLRDGDVALLPPSTSHGIEDSSSAPLSIYAVNLAPAFLDSLPVLLEEPRRLRRAALQSAMPDTLRRLLLEQTVQHAGFEAMMSGLGLQLLALLARNVQRAEPFVSDRNLDSLARVHLYALELERTFYRSETLDSVAHRLGLSRRTFTSLFRQVSGASWLQTQRRLRVRHAQKLLRESNRTVGAIAFECGWEEVTSFYRAFKSESGCSPEVWRKSGSQ